MKVNIKNIKCWISLIILLMSTTILVAQGWERKFPGVANPDGYIVGSGLNVFEEENGDIRVYSRFGDDYYFLMTDENGYQTNLVNLPVFGITMHENSMGDYIVLLNGSTTSEDTGFAKFDPEGNLIWKYWYGDENVLESATHFVESTDSDYFIIGRENIGSIQMDTLFVRKIDVNGEALWKKPLLYNFDQWVIETSIVATNDAGFLMAGFWVSNSPEPDEWVSFLIRGDSEGEIEWQVDFVDSMTIRNILTDEDDYIISGNVAINASPDPSTQLRLMKIDDSANILWSKEIDENKGAVDIIKTSDGGYALLAFDFIFEKVVLIKTDANGDIQWQEEYGGGFRHTGQSVKQTSDGGYIITGSAFLSDEANGPKSLYLIKTDANGIALSNVVEGYVQYDLNEDCINDLDEPVIEDWIISVENPAITFYGTTDENGYYAIEVDTGTFEVKVNEPSPYWLPCIASESITFDTDFDTTQVDYAVQSTEQCPLMEVTMHSGQFRLCKETQIVVNCKNLGTALAEDVYVEITFDDSLELIDASINYFLISGNTYSFDIGDVDFLKLETFVVDVMVGCDEELRGLTLCSEALIFPDTSCLPIDSLWSGASIELSAWCDEDEVKMKIANVGNADMQNELEYIVVEDDVIMLSGVPYGPLMAGDSVIVLRDADGTFYRIESPQVPNHPGMSMPSAFVEGCGEGSNGEVSLGFVNQYPLNDIDPFVDLLCKVVVSSFDPNIKVAYPEGYDTPHFINANTDIEYVIHFQNTGTAEAELVVIQDRISPLLDPASIRLGTSSHAYDFELFSDGIIKFTFEDIMLPDSTSNEAESHGFIQFTIAQKANLPVGTEIHNEAAIYFDFNSPIITNQTLHTIGDNSVSVNIGDVERPGVSVQVYPNPFELMTTFKIDMDNPEHLKLQLFDVRGRIIRQRQFNGNTYQFYKNDLPSGIYFYNISDKKGLINTGKILIH